MRSKSMGSVALSLLTLVIAALLALSAGSALSSSSDHRASGVAPADVGETLLPASHVGPGAGYVPPSVGETTVLINNTVYPGLFRSVDTYDDGGPFSWGTTPAYDPNTNLFYEPVSNVTESATSVYYGGYLAAISPVTDRLVQLIPVGLEPEGVVFDSSNGLLYVVNHDPGNISIVNPSTNATIGSLALPANSYTDGSIAVNSSSGHLFLVSPANGIYDVNIASNTSSVISSVAGGTYVVYDNQTGELYQVGNSIQVIGASNDTLWKTINFPSASSNTGAPAVDWKTDELYVPWGKNTSAVNLTTNTLGPTLSFNEVEGATPAAAFDPDNGMVYVISDYSSYNVTELNPATHQWVGSSPQIPSTEYGGIAYSNGSGEFLLTGLVQSGSSGFILMTPSLQVAGQPLSFEFPGTQSYFDPSTGYLFVAEAGVGSVGNVSVINPTSGKILGNVVAGLDPHAIWVDPTTGFGYIANFGPPPTGHVDNLTVFNARTFATTGSIPVGADPYSMTYDPVTEDLYVVNSGSLNITIINPATNSTVGSVSGFGMTPGMSLYDPSTSDIYVVGTVSGTDYGQIDTVDPATATVTYTDTSAFTEAFAAAFDGATGLIYIQDTNSAIYEIQEYDPVSGLYVGAIPLYHTTLYMAWDPVNGLLYAPDEFNSTNGGFDANSITEVNVTSGALVNLTVGERPNGIAVNESSGEAFVSNVDSGSVVFIDSGTPTSFSGYTVTFDTVPTSCSVTFNGVTYTDGQQATGVTGGSYTLVANACAGEMFSSWSSTAGTITSLTSASTSILVSANGIVTGTYTATSTGYTITFDVVPSTCSVTFDGVSYSNGNQVTGVAGGPYPISANACTGETFSSWGSTAGTVSSPTSTSTSILVSSSGTLTGTYASAPTGYTVTFDVVPSTCALTFNGNTYSNGEQATDVASGSYPLDANACTGETFTGWSSSAGTVASLTLSGTSVTVSATGIITATFTATSPGAYTITFVETGLPSGTSWSVTLSGTLLSNSTAAISAARADGTYDFTVGTVTGYTANVTSGSVIVSGADKEVEIGFTAKSTSTPGSSGPGGLSSTDLGLVAVIILAALLVLFFFIAARPHRNPVIFSAKGLPAGTSWSVKLDGKPQSSTETTIEFHVADGPHSFEVGTVKGYTASPSSGTVEVKKDRRVVPVAFSRITPAP